MYRPDTLYTSIPTMRPSSSPPPDTVPFGRTESKINMEYERIHPKPFSQGGGISPSKLRLMLLGVEKKRKEEKEDLESSSALRPESSTADVDDNHCESVSETCKDVTVVTLHIEYSTSPQMAGSVNGNPKDHYFLTNQRSIRSQHDDSFESDSGVSSGVFEFQKSDRTAHRKATAPFSKPAPSKWDDAQKWIASPTSNRHGKGGAQARRTGPLGYGNRPKVVIEGGEEFDTKRIDQNLVKKVGWVNEAYPTADSCAKPAVIIHCSASDSAINRSQHDSSAIQSDTGYVAPPATVRSVSMRDMGTEMTPIASQDPSRTGTPVRATSPKWSPASSMPSSPGRTVPNSTPAELVDGLREDNNRELTEQELKLKTRREIMVLGTRLGKTNIAAWASKGEEEKGFSATPRTVPVDPPDGRAIEIRAAAWEEAEKAKYLARYKREEIKIQALENHQKAKAEAELRKTEVEVERTRANAHDRLVRKLTAARLKAEEKLAAAEAKRNRQAARAAKESDFIRRTGQVPSSFTCWSWCL